MVSGVYKIFNTVTRKCYVGSAKDIHFRWRKHREMLKRGKHHSLKLQRSWNKHGEQAWQWVVVEECPEDALLIREQAHIDLLDVYRNGYNMSAVAGRVSMSEDGKRRVAEANHKRVCTNETRIKRSLALKGRPAWNKGVSVSNETKIKLQAAAKKPKSPEHRAKLAEHCRKMAAARRKPKTLKEPYKMTPEHRAHVVAALKIRNATGWQRDPEIVRKNSEGQRGRKRIAT